VSVRSRTGGDHGSRAIEDFIRAALSEIEQKKAPPAAAA
jgi:hypothetical protein